MATQWYYNHDGQNCGPIDGSQLKELAVNGTISRDTLLWKDGMKDWVPARKVKGLFAEPPPPTPTVAKGPPPVAKARAASSPSVNESIIVVKKAAVDMATDIKGKFHLQRIAIIAAASLGILATFLPWVSAPIIGTVYGTAGDGWITLCLFVPAVVLAFQGDRLAPLLGGARLGAIIPAGIAGLIGIIKIVQFRSNVSNLDDDNPFSAALSVSVQLRIGIFLLVFAGIGVCVAAWILEKRRHGSTTY